MPNKTSQQGEISNFQLKFSYWYVTHKVQLRKALIIFLILLSVIFYGYSIFRLFTILIIDYQENRAIYYSLSDQNYINYNYFHQSQKPADLQVLNFTATDGRDDRYDFVIQLKNPNVDFVAENVVLQLISGTEIVAEKSTFIFPGEEKYVAIFGQELPGIGTPNLKIASISWHRYHDFAEFYNKRINFVTKDIEFTPAKDLKIKGELPVSTLAFEITNDTAFNYWEVGLNMVLLSGGRVVAANYFTLDEFLAQETRNVEMRWHEPLSSIDQVVISPEVNIVDDSSYLPVQSLENL